MEQTLERGALYVVGTPIGNLGDFSPRARETLEGADFIAAEDTRVTLRLLNHFGIKKPLLSYFEHNKLEHGPMIVARLRQGETCALVSDAGMPAISDSGETLVACFCICIRKKPTRSLGKYPTSRTRPRSKGRPQCPAPSPRMGL